MTRWNSFHYCSQLQLAPCTEHVEVDHQLPPWSPTLLRSHASPEPGRGLVQFAGRGLKHLPHPSHLQVQYHHYLPLQ